MPYILQKNRVCSKCGVVGGLFYAQRRKNRPLKLNIHRICQRCKREDNRDSYYRCSEGKRKRYERKIDNIFMTEMI